MTAPKRRVLHLILTLVGLSALYEAIYLPYLPNARGGLGADYSFFLPNLLAGYYWHLQNGWWALPWFTPSQCGGVPFFADPQVPFLSAPQFLAFVMPPVEAVQSSVMLFAVLGSLGAFTLARVTFRTSSSAAALAGALFMFNQFYAARMMVGHLGMQPFMLTPALAACVLAAPDATATRRRFGAVLPTILGGIIVAIMIHGGAIQILPPCLLAVLILAAVHAIRFGTVLVPKHRLAGVLVIGGALCASKLAAGFALLANFPRDQYSLPGIPGLGMAFWRAAQCLFLWPPPNPEAATVNGSVGLHRHEWEYGITIVPLLLLAAWLARSLATRPRLARMQSWAMLACLLAIPVVLNWYQPDWNEFLKEMPVIGSSSTLLRWFAAYIPPATLAAALALDAIAPAQIRARLAFACILGTIAIDAAADHSAYGPDGQGVYGAATIEAAWHTAARTGTGPRITAIRPLTDPAGRMIVGPAGQDALAFGYSQLLCYQPLFGYGLERFPIGTLHPGPALSAADGVLNVKNPACYVFPKANSCKPGDPFPEARADDAQAFLDYRPFPFQEPAWARFAGWLSRATPVGLVALALAASAKNFAWPFRKSALSPRRVTIISIESSV